MQSLKLSIKIAEQSERQLTHLPTNRETIMTDTTTKTDSFHVSNYGAFGKGFQADRAGYVHLTTEAVIGGDWDKGDTAEDEAWFDEVEAADIAAYNVQLRARADAALAKWQSEGA